MNSGRRAARRRAAERNRSGKRAVLLQQGWTLTRSLALRNGKVEPVPMGRARLSPEGGRPPAHRAGAGGSRTVRI